MRHLIAERKFSGHRWELRRDLGIRGQVFHKVVDRDSVRGLTDWPVFHEATETRRAYVAYDCPMRIPKAVQAWVLAKLQPTVSKG